MASTMFNADQKEQFINYCLQKSDAQDTEGIRQQLEGLFAKLGKLEKDFGKDFCEYDFESAMLVVHTVVKGKPTYQMSLLSRLRQYLDWCIQNGKTPLLENVLHGIKVEDIDSFSSYKLTMIKDQEQLSKYIHYGFNADSLNTVHNVHRVYCLLLFDGVPIKDIFELKKHQFNSQLGIIGLKDREIKLCKQTITETENLINLNEFTQFNLQGAFTKSKAKGDYIITHTSEDRSAYDKYFARAVSLWNQRLRESLNENLTIPSTNIYISGIFYRVYLNEMKTGKIDLSEYPIIFKTQPSEKVYNQRNEHALLQYKNWKKAFDL